MFTVYSGSGALDYKIGDAACSDHDWVAYKNAACKILKNKHQLDSADFLEKTKFNLLEGENFFGDDFCVLHAKLPVDEYADIVKRFTDTDQRSVFEHIAASLNDICPYYIRFISFSALIVQYTPLIEAPVLRITNRTVEEALADARHLISARGSTSGIDRAHTAFHGYLRVICEDAHLEVSEDADISRLYRKIKEGHPNFSTSNTRSSDIDQIIKTLGSIITVLNPLRNRASLAHPNENLLAKPEANLVLNSIHTILQYLDEKVG